jgi:hypothetical protein
MIAFFLQVTLLLRTFWHGLRQDAEFRTLGILLAIALLGGTVFYWQLEGWSVLDSLYFCVMTLSTIGFGDLAPTSEVSKAFTILFALLGIGLFASFVAKVVALRFDSHAKRHQHHKHRAAR